MIVMIAILFGAAFFIWLLSLAIELVLWNIDHNPHGTDEEQDYNPYLDD